MIIIRPLALSDADTFIDIAFSAGIGMTSMPKNRDVLLQRLHTSEASFKKNVSSPADEFYLFVLEDLNTGKIGGTCGIAAQTGRRSPIFFYRVEKREKHEDIAHGIKKIPTLRAVQYRNYWSEICSLYLSPDFRHSGLGRLLSLSRFLFIAEHPQRFSKMIFAEMRGAIDDHCSLFWEGVGRHFIETDFANLMHLRDDGQVDLTQALPAHPIYIELLPKDVQESIGKIHSNTEPALHMLQQEGFSLSPEIDICDGGPKIEAETKEVRTIKESLVGTVSEITSQQIPSPQHIIATRSHNFRACLDGIATKNDHELIISKETAEGLKVKVGDPLRYVPAHSKHKTEELST